MRNIQHYENRIARLITKDSVGNYHLIQKAKRHMRQVESSK